MFLSIFFATITLLVILCTTYSLGSNCEEKGLYCSIAGGTRRVNGVDVYRECWQYKYNMECEGSSKNDCNRIDVNKCSFIGEECISNEKEGDLSYCGNLKRKYSCEKEIEWEEERAELIKEGKAVDGKDLLCVSLCIDGNCDAVKKAGMEEDSEIGKAAAMLNSLKEAKEGIEGERLVNVFKGSKEECEKQILNFTNCCTKMGGWGEILGGRCYASEKNLAKKRREKKCVEVGEYCSSEIPIIGCITRNRVFCCYDSIIARIINQEAKKQLGKDNGTAERPQCGGLNIEDLEKVDLSKADFKEFYEEVVIPNINVPDVKADISSNKRNVEDIAKSASKLPSERKGFNEKSLREGVQ